MPSLRTLTVAGLVAGLVGGWLLAQQLGQVGQAPPAAAPPAPKIAAVVDGENITEAEVTAALQSQLRGQQVPPETLEELRRLVLDALINGRLVEQFLAEQKITADPQRVESIIQQLKQRVAAVGLPFAEILKRQGHTEQSLRRRIAGELAFEKYAQQQITEETVREYFQAHKEEYDGTKVEASHLLIRVEEDAGPEQKKAAMAKIKAIRQEIVGGLAFEEAARKYSEGPSGPDGGKLGAFERHGEMVEPFAAAAFALKKGEISEPVETRFGLHLIRVTNRIPGTKQLAEVQDTLRQALTLQLWKETAAKRRAEAKIELPK